MPIWNILYRKGALHAFQAWHPPLKHTSYKKYMIHTYKQQAFHDAIIILSTSIFNLLTSKIWSPGFRRPSCDTAPSGKISCMTVHICRLNTSIQANHQQINLSVFIFFNMCLCLLCSILTLRNIYHPVLIYIFSHFYTKI